MVRKIVVVVPIKQSDKIRDVLLMNRSVHNLSYRSCLDEDNRDSISFTFKVVNKKTHEIIDLLTLYGVSNRFGSLDVTALTSTKPRVTTYKEMKYDNENQFGSSMITSKRKKKKYAIHERLAYDEIYDTIDSQLHLTFDYLALIVSGGIISAIGLLTNSPVTVVASMLVSPLMGPIVGMTFGCIVRDKEMFWKSFRNELIGLLLCFVTGGVMGFITAPILDDPTSDQLVRGINTQISSRGEWEALLWGIGIAAPSGVGVALGVSSDQVSALIGVAISAALLPPIVNSGLCITSAIIFFMNPEYEDDIVREWVEMGGISMLLFLLNWLLIFCCGILTFRVKKLNQSANDQERNIKLGAFYDIVEKTQNVSNSNSNSKNSSNHYLSPNLPAHKKSNTNVVETLKTPLLLSKSQINYSDKNNNKGIIKEIILNNNNNNNNLNESNTSSISGLNENMDNIPKMLAALSDANLSNDNKNNNMMNWNTTRHTRGMSDMITIKIHNDKINDDIKYKTKRLSVDGLPPISSNENEHIDKPDTDKV